MSIAREQYSREHPELWGPGLRGEWALGTSCDSSWWDERGFHLTLLLTELRAPQPHPLLQAPQRPLGAPAPAAPRRPSVFPGKRGLAASPGPKAGCLLMAHHFVAHHFVTSGKSVASGVGSCWQKQGPPPRGSALMVRQTQEYNLERVAGRGGRRQGRGRSHDDGGGRSGSRTSPGPGPR